MKESWRYYDFLRRWGLLLLLGLVLGALAGWGFYAQQDKQPRFKAEAAVSISTQYRPGVWRLRAKFDVTSSEYSDPKSAVESIVKEAENLDARPELLVDIGAFSIEGRYRSPLWKTVVLGGVFGGLLVIGAAYVWDDARAYMRNRQETGSDDV